jgi:hypothetical protein
MAAPKAGTPPPKVTAKPAPSRPVAKPTAKPPANPPARPPPKVPPKSVTPPATAPPLAPQIADAGQPTAPMSASSTEPIAGPVSSAPAGTSAPTSASGSASASPATAIATAPGADAGAAAAAPGAASASSAAPAHVELPPARLVIDFATSSTGPAWFVAGLEDVVGNELRRFHTVELTKKIDPARCPTRDPRCFVDQYRAEKVEVIILGKLEPRSPLQYQVYDTWTGARAFEGVLKVSGVSSSALEREIGDIVRPIVQRGGLVDQRPPLAPPANARATAPVRSPAASGHGLETFVGAMILLVASPIVLAFLLVGRVQLGRRAKPASWRWSALLLLLLAGIPIATSTADIPALYVRLASRAPPLLGLLPPALAGMLWGGFALSLAAWLVAPVHGLERIRHDALWPLLRSWTVLVLLRATATAFLYAPVAILTLRTCAEIALPDRMTLAFVLPAVGLVTHFWLLSLVDNLSLYLDRKLVTGLPTPRNPWHATIRRYFLGYVKRNVVAIDEKVLERTLFLPSVRAGVISYGGGFARPRILVGEKALETALGELPDEEESPDRTVNAEELPLGILMPTLKSTDDAAQLARGEQWRRKVTLSPARGRAYMPRLLGENATLLGWIAAQTTDKGLPLISDTEEDFGVVKHLLSEHYSAFGASSEDDEVDDTDPTQKDFLFGALLREIGVIVRHDVYFGTIGLTIAVIASGPSFFARLVRLPLSLYERFFSAPAAKIADAYAALNSGLHHLVQYLCYVRGADEKLLTNRANMPRLIETSRTMLAKLERDEPEAGERDAFRATPRDRADWLTTVFEAGMAPGRVRWGRILVAVAFATLAGFFVVRSIRASIAYHPTYVERMKSTATEPTPPQGENAR